VFIAFCVIAAVFLIYEHTVHVLGVLPYLLLLACPLMHFFMHHGHHHHGGSDSSAGSQRAAPTQLKAEDLDKSDRAEVHHAR
jgi:hypothetical protein